MSNLNFNEVLARAQANQTRQVQEGTPAGISAINEAWFAAIGNKPPPKGSSPMERAQDAWQQAVDAEAVVDVDEAAAAERLAQEIAAEREQHDREWAAYRAANPPVDPVRAAALALAQAEKDDARREAAFRIDAERADREVEALWRARELAAGVAS